ncbi:MAG: hypothetical protein HRT74_00290 [Flavobacteriales bacterium]|nr:hypothetical protein [Flavobacteriales bacterium]
MRWFCFFAIAMWSIVGCKSVETCEVKSSFESGAKKEERCTLDKKTTHTEYYEAGKVYMQGEIREGELREGVWQSFYEDGTMWSEHHYVDGVKDGAYKVFWPNGNNRIEGQYSKGQEVGLWKFFDQQGVVVQEKQW